MEPAPLVPAGGTRDAPGRGFSDGGDLPGAILKTSTGLPRWDLLMRTPGTEPHKAPSLLQRTGAFLLPLQGLRWAGKAAPSPSPWKTTHPRSILPLPPNLPFLQGRVFPVQGNTAAPSPASLGLSGYLPPRIRSYGSDTVDDFMAGTSQPLRPRWVSTLRVAPIRDANARPHSRDPQPRKPWGHATLLAGLSHPSRGWRQGTLAGAGLSLRSPRSILCSSPVRRAQPSSQKAPVRRLLHFPPPASIVARRCADANQFAAL